MCARDIVRTINGEIRPLTREFRDLMKQGIQRNLVLTSEFKGPKLKLDAATKEEISYFTTSIKKSMRKIEKLEDRKAEFGISIRDKSCIEWEIEYEMSKIFEAQQAIRSIKKAFYKNQKNILDIDG